MDRKKKAIIISCIFILSIFLLVAVIPKSSSIPVLPVASTYSSAPSAPAGGITLSGEKCQYQYSVIVNVTDYNGNPLAGVTVTYNGGYPEITNSSGLVTYTLYKGTYNFSAYFRKLKDFNITDN